ncbi:hypothetical protein [Aliirhizobium cellulosilyticum]|uniref:Uncharacterized protein n=1 Tax=Aliirhizobium cellulosilyticum TaxID=393664 RepID=A0A7W6UU16_9HYPH|nr:hypothetical protein [Rhizobium cellulosilyticum]MBB4347935.1 hypothetical protein [Rhizobium cellulosilyticum]MBB4409671.1 hypothetical protein [Rhizobium cellulosilyticum]MBB4444358.1 hypothetical protein [Rhizobium cellulosilyticum]
MTTVQVISASHGASGEVFFRIQIDGDSGTELVSNVYRSNDPYAGPIGEYLAGWIEEHSSEIGPFVPPQPEPALYQISKTTPWLRMTDEEAAVMDAVMSETGARLKQIYMAATYLASNDPLWATLHEMLANAFGSARADQLLAPET